MPVAALPAVADRETAAALAVCLDCASALEGRDACPGCGRRYPEEHGILSAIGPLTGRNRIAAAFYDGPHWRRFRPWERFFLVCQGGQRAARRKILRHLPRTAQARVLEVGIGDGENKPLLPQSWSLFGVDIARTQLSACRERFPELAGRLVWAEAEALPFAEGTFDAVYTIGGFNYFRDHLAALREMRRVARPGAPVVVADEIPTLFQLAPGHFVGLDELDRWGLRVLGLDAEFIEMVLGHQVQIDALVREEWPKHRRYTIWNRLGYCLVDADTQQIT
jgi:SAM-dependent methyltransferase